MSTPWVAFGNEELRVQPRLAAGQRIQCPTCGKRHRVKDSATSGTLLFYTCGETTYLAGIDGRSIMRANRTSGTIETKESEET